MDMNNVMSSSPCDDYQMNVRNMCALLFPSILLAGPLAMCTLEAIKVECTGFVNVEAGQPRL